MTGLKPPSLPRSSSSVDCVKPDTELSIDDDLPLDPVRTALALLLVAIFVVCFMPVPLSPLELIGGH